VRRLEDRDPFAEVRAGCEAEAFDLAREEVGVGVAVEVREIVKVVLFGE